MPDTVLPAVSEIDGGSGEPAAPPVDETLLSEADWLSAWAGEPILWHPGEAQPGELDPGRLRGDALAAARLEHSLGLPFPSRAWRRRYGLLLGLSRLTASDPVRLADGTHLAEHQVEVPEALLAAATGRLEGRDDPARPRVTAADPNRDQRYWVEHATGAGKTVLACALVDACRGGGALILTHRSALVDQFRGELTDRGYGHRLADITDPALDSHPNPVCVTTYQQWGRRWTEHEPDQFALYICDEVHQALGEKMANVVQAIEDTIVVGMTATGQLLSKDVSQLFERQVSSFDLHQAARAGVISPLRCLRVPPPMGTDTLEGIRSRGGDFDTEALAGLLDRDPLNHGCARMYRDTFGQRSGVIYAAGVRHAERVASAFIGAGVSAAAVSGRTPRRELAKVLEDYEAGRLQVVVNADLLVEGWNSPRAEVCLHLAPTASSRVYQQRTGRVTRRAEGKAAGIVVDFVDPGYANDGRVMTLHKLLDCDEYVSGQAVTSGPDGRVADTDPPVVWEPMAVVPVAADADRRSDVLKRHWLQISTAHLTTADRLVWATAAGHGAPGIGHLRRALDRLRDEDKGLTVACLAAAARTNPRQECRQLACDRLADLAVSDPQAWQALTQLVLASDDASLQRRLSNRALDAAASGAADEVSDAHELLMDLARLQRSSFDRVARRNKPVKDTVGDRPMPDDISLIEQLSLRAMISERAEGVALLVALPSARPREAATVLEAAWQLCPAPTDLARALQDARQLF